MGVTHLEGVDGDGFIVSGADIRLIPVLYRPVLESSVSTLTAAVDGLVAIYLYGSVATGRASPPESDIDLLVLMEGACSKEAILDAASELSRRYREVARDVGVADLTIGGLFGDDLEGLSGRCFVKHYCVPLHGDDIRDRLPKYRPSPRIAWAFNHNVAAAIDEARQRLTSALGDVEVRGVCRVVSRKVMFAGASLMSVITSSWTTDRRRAAAFIAEQYPGWAEEATLMLEWGSAPTGDPSEVRAMLDGFATWLAQEFRDKAAVA